MNRIADVFFILAIILIFINFKTTEFTSVFTLLSLVVNNHLSFFSSQVFLIDLIACFLFIGAIGKSAQIGLHTWLPDAWKALLLLVHYYMLLLW